MLGAVEILALIFAVAILFKILVVSINSKSWMKIVRRIYKKPSVLFGIQLIIAVIVIYYLLLELSFVQIMASILLGALLTGMTFAIYAKEIVPMFLKMLKDKKMMNKAWLLVLVWLALAVWVLLEIFLF